MRAKLSALAAAAAIALIPATAAASQQPGVVAHVSKQCSAGFMHARIGGAQKCLRRGEYCAKRYKKQYRRYGYRCIRGRLR